MSCIVDLTPNIFERFCINVIKCGPVPKHIAFIMDGNRRYASKNKIQKTEGHFRGFSRLAETLQWCVEIGITEVTVYAFSIENFKRSKDEVDALMKLSIEKFEKLFEDDRIMSQGIRIRVIGNLSLLPEELRRLIAKATLMTRNNNKVFLNVALAYTSRNEITNTTKTIVEGVKKGLLIVEDINEDLISDCLYTNESPDPNMLVRTSGEVRFSDFLLWQTSNSDICFTQVLWPDFRVWGLLFCVLKYQRSYKDLKKSEDRNGKKNERVQKFLNHVQQHRLEQLKSYL